MNFLVISGLSGAGKSKFASVLEDLGYYCVDNMPVDFIPQFAGICLAAKGRYEQVALVTDIRGGLSFDGLFNSLDTLKKIGCDYKIVFIEATAEVIINRYKETRRKHPLANDGLTLVDAVSREMELLRPVRDKADYIIDTTSLLPSKLRGEIIRLFADQRQTETMTVNVESFGYKYGIPIDADLVFDVRFLPNPFYEDNLRELTGLDEPVRDFIMSFSRTTGFLDKLQDLIAFLLPMYTDEGKTSLTIAIGCTGGHHRSAAIAVKLGEFVKQKGYSASVTHRDIARE